jgi:hypothetical protein
MEQTVLMLACMPLIIIYYTFAHMATFTAKTAAVATKPPFLPLQKTAPPPPPIYYILSYKQTYILQAYLYSIYRVPPKNLDPYSRLFRAFSRDSGVFICALFFLSVLQILIIFPSKFALFEVI